MLAIQRAALATLVDKATAERLLVTATDLGKGLLLIDRGEFGEAEFARLREEPGVQPVFDAAGALVVALPEVRVEESRGAREKSAVRSWLKHRAVPLAIDEVDGRFTVHLESGRGRDALDLANALVEDLGPEMAQARFVRLVRKPQAKR